MTWFRVDDKFHSHVKPARAGLAAVGAWTLAGSWCGDHLTDGRIPREVAHKLAPKGLWEKLFQAGLVTLTDEGYQLHDFLDWNPSAERVKTERARKSEGGKAGGLAKAAALAAAKQTASTCQPSASGDSVPPPLLPSRPVPSRPEDHTHSPREVAPAGDDLLKLAVDLRDEGSSFGADVCIRAAKGWRPTGPQLTKLRQIQAERQAAARDPPRLGARGGRHPPQPGAAEVDESWAQEGG